MPTAPGLFAEAAQLAPRLGLDAARGWPRRRARRAPPGRPRPFFTGPRSTDALFIARWRVYDCGRVGDCADRRLVPVPGPDLRREGLLGRTVAFKGGTTLRRFVFGASGRFSVDLNVALRRAEPGDEDLVLDMLDGASFAAVQITTVHAACMGESARARPAKRKPPCPTPSRASARS